METSSTPSLETSSTLAATTSIHPTTVEEYSSETEEVGIVADVVPARKFGFISVLDVSSNSNNNITKDENNQDQPDGEGKAPTTPKVREKVFFHFNDVVVSANSENKKTPLSIRKGDEVKMNIAVVSKPGVKKKKTAVNITILRRAATHDKREKINNSSKKNVSSPASGGESKNRSVEFCQGWILMEPSYTSLASSHRNTHKKISSTAVEGDSNNVMSPNTRWKNSSDAEDDQHHHHTKASTNEDGFILILRDPHGLFVSTATEEESNNDQHDSNNEVENHNRNGSKTSKRLCQISYSKPDLHRMQNHGPPPRRGDLVAFAKSSKGGVKDIRVVKRNAARFVKGTLTHLDLESNSAKFVLELKDKSKHGKGSRREPKAPVPIDIHLSEVLGCNAKALKEGEPVEGMMVGGFLYGISRTKDLYIASTVTPPSSEGGKTSSAKERPRLNLTVRKELQTMGGKIIAQSSMAKGPDGTNGFAESWTSRHSLFPDGVLREEV